MPFLFSFNLVIKLNYYIIGLKNSIIKEKSGLKKIKRKK
jgi:hypothetical protein